MTTAAGQVDCDHEETAESAQVAPPVMHLSQPSAADMPSDQPKSSTVAAERLSENVETEQVAQ